MPQTHLLTRNTDEPISHNGIIFYQFMSYINDVLQPRSYFEIGTQAGGTLSRFDCDAVCVDPNFLITTNAIKKRRRASFFQMTSDEFFSEYNLLDIFPKGVDVMFLDGMHRFEYLLRDFIYAEKYAHDGTLIILHDCLPTSERMTERVPHPSEAWTGDVWKMIPILKKFRPEIRIQYVDCPPSGLALCTNMTPFNNNLKDNYYKIVDEFLSKTVTDFGFQELWSLFPTIDSKSLLSSPHDGTSLITSGWLTWK